MTRQGRHVAERRAKGLCAYEGCDEVSGKSYRCEQHAKQHWHHERFYRFGIPLPEPTCVCGATAMSAPVCGFYETGRHFFTVEP